MFEENEGTKMSTSLTKSELILVGNLAKEILKGPHHWNADFLARQIVDDAWRSGIDIRSKQHLVETWLEKKGLACQKNIAQTK